MYVGKKKVCRVLYVFYKIFIDASCFKLGVTHIHTYTHNRYYTSLYFLSFSTTFPNRVGVLDRESTFGITNHPSSLLYQDLLRTCCCGWMDDGMKTENEALLCYETGRYRPT